MVNVGGHGGEQVADDVFQISNVTYARVGWVVEALLIKPQEPP